MLFLLHKSRKLLRSRLLIVGEVAAITVAGVLGATIPQAGVATEAEVARLRAHGPVLTAIVDFFALDHVFKSAWFVALMLVAAASLAIAVVEQVRRLRRDWSRQLAAPHFQKAPFRAEFERPARSAADSDNEADVAAKIDVRTRGRIGLAGSPVFHVGLLLVVLAGALRALFGVSAAVDLMEGETLPATAEAWGAQWPGALARPFRLDCSVTLDAVRATRYDGGDLRGLRIRLTLDQAEGPREEEIAVNHDLRAPGGRLFLGTDFGAAALIEWRAARGSGAEDEDGRPASREAVLLAGRGKGEYVGSSPGPGGVKAYLRAWVGRAGARPGVVEARVMREGALLFAGRVKVGDAVPLHGGTVLRLHGLPLWARLRGSRDPGLWLAYAGFALVIAGAAIIFGVVKVDTCVSVTQAGTDKERVTVALRAQRFAPLFRERFGRLVREEGGPG